MDNFIPSESFAPFNPLESGVDELTRWLMDQNRRLCCCRPQTMQVWEKHAGGVEPDASSPRTATRGRPGPDQKKYTPARICFQRLLARGLFVHRRLMLAHIEISLFHYLGRNKLC
jgi:hypothetical protein